MMLFLFTGTADCVRYFFRYMGILLLCLFLIVKKQIFHIKKGEHSIPGLQKEILSVCSIVCERGIKTFTPPKAWIIERPSNWLFRL